MKNVLLTALALLGLSAFAPRAEAGGFFRVSDRHDHCDRPTYSRSRSYSSYYAPTYSRTYRPEYYSYPRPTYVRESCHSSYRGYRSTPRFSISFGF